MSLLRHVGTYTHAYIPVSTMLCPTQMAYWAKNHVAILTRAAHLMTY